MSDAAARGPLVPPAGWLGPPPDATRRVGSRYLIVVTLLGVILRLYHLGSQSLFVDEAFTWQMIAPGQGLHFWPQILEAYQGPLYHALAWIAVRIEATDVALRLPAALAGAAAIPLMGLLGQRLFGRMAGRLAALLLALSPFHLWYSQQARGYSLLILFAVASGLVFLRLRDEPPTWGRAIALALLVAGGLASNLAFGFLLVAYALTLLVTAPPRGGRAWALWCVALGGGVVLTLPWLLKATGIWAVDRVLPGVATGEALRGETTFTPLALPFSAFSLLYGFSLGPSLAQLHDPQRLAVLRHFAPIIAVAALVGAVAIIAGLVRLRGRQWALLLWIAVPVAGVVLLSMRNIKPYNVRYVATILPWVLALAAAGAARLRRPGNLLLSLALCLLFVVSLGGYYFDARFASADVRAAVAYIRGSEARDLPILAPNVGLVVSYYSPPGQDVRRCGSEPRITDPQQAAALVERQLAGVDAAWYVAAQTWSLDPHGLLPGALAARGELVRVFSAPGITVDMWRRGPTGSAP